MTVTSAAVRRTWHQAQQLPRRANPGEEYRGGGGDHTIIVVIGLQLISKCRRGQTRPTTAY